MSKARGLRTSILSLGFAVVCGPFFAGCGEEESKPIRPEDAPAVQAKDSMEYYRSKHLPKKPGKAATPAK